MPLPPRPRAPGFCRRPPSQDPPPARPAALPAKPDAEPAKTDSGIDLRASTPLPQRRLPRFHFPFGRPAAAHPLVSPGQDQAIRSIFSVSPGSPGTALSERDFCQVTLACGIPRYLNAVFFRRASRGAAAVDYARFASFWTEITAAFHSLEAVAFGILKEPDCSFVTPKDVEVAVQDVTLHHPGLEFLSSLPVFQNRYVETVVTRLFYAKNKNWNKQMTFAEFKKSDFVARIQNLEHIEDINWTHDFFSYQHFYVIYCKFWELDRDHDMLIDLQALRRYDHFSLSERILRRVIGGFGKLPSHSRPRPKPASAGAPSASASASGPESALAASASSPSSSMSSSPRLTSSPPAVAPPSQSMSHSSSAAAAAQAASSSAPHQPLTLPPRHTTPTVMSYEDFIYFILSVEEKRTIHAIEYWFRCLDLDGDGFISLYEIGYFFEEQYERMLGNRMTDLWRFEDFVCSLLDLIRPEHKTKISLSDLKHSASAPLFFDMLFDLHKYENHIRRIDPAFRDQDDVTYEGPHGEHITLTGFQKFAARTYQFLAEEESAAASISHSTSGQSHMGGGGLGSLIGGSYHQSSSYDDMVDDRLMEGYLCGAGDHDHDNDIDTDNIGIGVRGGIPHEWDEDEYEMEMHVSRVGV
ncbi:hypothetical protein HK105_203498 [Polyrhizophydium stewartii]|uniref:EF-hand domain-containing protein n=1 Tax=Polyrhizophydium stewartii TaxID=2732419 RepID=A0ABR4NC08_9FUNG